MNEWMNKPHDAFQLMQRRGWPNKRRPPMWRTIAEVSKWFFSAHAVVQSTVSYTPNRNERARNEWLTAAVCSWTSDNISSVPGARLCRFTSNLARPTGTWVRLAVQNFTSIGAGGVNAAPKYQKFPLFGKESPRRGESFDQFLKFSGPFIRRTILH